MGLLSGLSLFTGAGGLDLAAESVGIRTVCRVEWSAYRQASLMSRIRGGELFNAPLWDDVTTFDGRPFRGLVDVIFGGDPCQPHSFVGKMSGLEDARWLWPDYLRIIKEVQPRFVIRENVHVATHQPLIDRELQRSGTEHGDVVGTPHGQ